jgi:hypothetical protein
LAPQKQDFLVASQWSKFVASKTELKSLAERRKLTELEDRSGWRT